MKTRYWNLIVIPPSSERVEKFHLSWKSCAVLAAAFVLAFLLTVLLFLMFPRLQVKDFDRSRLEAENQTLKVENKNLAFGIQRLDAQVTRAEEHSKQVEALMHETD